MDIKDIKDLLVNENLLIVDKSAIKNFALESYLQSKSKLKIYLDTKEVSRILGVSSQTVRNLAKRLNETKLVEKISHTPSTNASKYFELNSVLAERKRLRKSL
jgi:CTP-dependent riboflavin kinase